MKPLFWDLSPLDNDARDNFSITEEIMMEHAALAIKEQIVKRFPKGSTVLVATGSGNNGADGFVLARLLSDYKIEIYEATPPKSDLCKLQKLRCEKLALNFTEQPKVAYDVVVDAIFGSGLANNLDEKISEIIRRLNKISGFKIACDFPSGLTKKGLSAGEVFNADLCISMGAANIGLFSDLAKNHCGEIIVATLGLGDKEYLKGHAPLTWLLEESDLKLPFRHNEASHKGNYGHLGVYVGDKEGAGTLCGLSALGFGAGAVTLISKRKMNIPFELMQDDVLPTNVSTIAIGCGLGTALESEEIKQLASQKYRFLIDADMFYKNDVLCFLDKPSVLTPHPKEFASLLKISAIGDFDTEYIQQNRFELATLFCSKYRSTVLVLKGANTIIGNDKGLFVCALGSPSLAKAGSGDVLSGLIAALLAQGYTHLDGAINGVLAHAVASKKVKNNYALTPTKLIEIIKEL